MALEDPVDAYRRELAAVLDGKDPRAAKVDPGSALLVFAEPGTLTRTLTVQIQATRVAVVDGGASLEGERTVLVRASLADWLITCESGARAPNVEVYGDSAVLADVGKLMDSKRDFIAARFFRGK